MKDHECRFIWNPDTAYDECQICGAREAICVQCGLKLGTPKIHGPEFCGPTHKKKWEGLGETTALKLVFS